MPKYDISYSYMRKHCGSKNEIISVLRELTYARDFDPTDVDNWSVSKGPEEIYFLEARVTVRKTLHKSSQLEAIRSFVFEGGLPSEIDLSAVVVKEVGYEPLVPIPNDQPVANPYPYVENSADGDGVVMLATVESVEHKTEVEF